MMKKLGFLIALSALGLACENAATPVSQSNSAKPAATNERPQTAIAHSSEDQTSKPVAPAERPRWSQSGDPVDTTKYDAAITSAEKALAGKPSDQAAKKALADAYYERGFALTEARQYASALGDYRKAIKHDPSNTEAKGWIDKIVMIYDSMSKAYPKEGEEPPPLPFKKAK
ncbi:MAG: tetratricopeptide repeat protein [Pyrinomonadaceae bacterium]